MGNNQGLELNNLWHQSYSRKLISGIAEQKNKFDNCLYWLLLLNTGIFGGILGIIVAGLKNQLEKEIKYEALVFVTAVGILWTWMIMLRSATAYRQLKNFDKILDALHDYTKEKNNCNKDRLDRCVKFLDYSRDDIERSYILTPTKTLIQHFTWEYGPLFFIHAVILGYSISSVWVFGVKNEIFLRALFYIFALIMFMIVTYVSIFHKKEIPWKDRALNELNKLNH